MRARLNGRGAIAAPSALRIINREITVREGENIELDASGYFNTDGPFDVVIDANDSAHARNDGMTGATWRGAVYRGAIGLTIIAAGGKTWAGRIKSV